MKRWLIGLGLVLALFWVIGGFQSHIPGQEEHPALAKVRLCEVASDTHDAFIRASLEDGLVRKAGTIGDGVYEFEVDAAAWAEFPIESQEVLAIAGWCKAASDEGKGSALIISATSREELASVIDGEFTTARERGPPGAQRP